MRIVVVGGVAAGASAAVKARRVNESAEILVFERGPYASFANCGLPYHVGEEIKEEKDLLVVPADHFKTRFNIELFTQHEVVCIHPDKKQVEVKDLRSGEIRAERYDKLILAPGARPVIPPIPGRNLRYVFTLSAIPDAREIKALVDRGQVKHAVVVGGGFIGLEVAEALLIRGIKVTVVEALDQLLPPFDPEMANIMADALRGMGAEVILNNPVKALHGVDEVEEVELQSGRRIPASLVVISVGVRPEVKLAAQAGLAIGDLGGIIVDEYMRTSDPDIYAAGDVVETVHRVTGKKVWVPLAGPANKQGRVAGANAAGGNLKFKGILGSTIVRVGKLVAARTGLSEKEARKEGISYFVSYTHSPDHAGYYPGSELMAVKIIGEQPTGRLLGAQIVGPKGVDKRIDVLATAIMAGMSVYDLEDLDLAYSPPFSSAKDPVNIAGFTAANIIRGEVAVMTARELAERINRGQAPLVIDVRTPGEYARGHIPHAVNMPLDSFRSKIDGLPKDRPMVLYCRIGYRSYVALRALDQRGFGRVYNLSGGFLTWEMSGYKVEK